MQHGELNWIASYIWGIADDVLRDLYVRGKYRDVILPMTVLRRLDAVLEDSKADVLERRDLLDKAGVVEPTSLTSCYPILHTARVGRATSTVWVARATCATRAFSLSMGAILNTR